jgi:hypothetical protein
MVRHVVLELSGEPRPAIVVPRYPFDNHPAVRAVHTTKLVAEKYAGTTEIQVSPIPFLPTVVRSPALAAAL